MDKRYQVFVSSTYEDLVAERQEVMHALLELECIFPAANEDQWTLIRKVIDECDYYLLISAGRYGTVGPTGVGYTELEYRYALEIEKPIIAFLHRNPQQLPASSCEDTDDGRKRLESFRELLQQRVCKFWESPAELGSVASRSLIRLIKTTPAVGWVRADEAANTLAATEVLQLRRKIDELEARLRVVTLSAPPGSERLSQGEDLVTVSFTFESMNAARKEYRWSQTTKISWNDIFYEIGPLMLDEATDQELSNSLDEVVYLYSKDELRKMKDLKGHKVGNFEITDHDFQTIKIQLRALGLIEKSEKRARSVRDQRTYWSLTEYGDRVLTNLRAIPKDSPQSSGLETDAGDEH